MFGEQLGALVKQVVGDANGVERDVSRDDPRRPVDGGQQGFGGMELEPVNPDVELLLVAGSVERSKSNPQRFQIQGENGGTRMMFAPRLGRSRINAVAARIVDNSTILDHSPFGKNDHLAAAQDFLGQKRQQTGMVVGQRAKTNEIVCESVVSFKEFRCRHGSTECFRFLVDQILRDERLEAGEMIKQKDFAACQIIVALM
ncbi:MAG: hypothetical protein O7D94_01200 [Planctomycetota bacterium]|nr:hypothetical protein [Planctomycetota bacterium]